jgi:DNA-binding CsgD family transcriptional regulator
MAGPAAEGRLLDRSTELSAITGLVTAASAGTGAALLIEGVAGIGKTRLLAHACQQAARAGLTVLTASAAEFEAGYAWGVVRQLFGTEPGTAGGGLAGTDPPGPGDAAALAAPALGPGGPGADEDAFSILHGLYWLTSALAQRAPLLIAVDDLQWADEPSLRYVLHLARRLEGLPVLLVVTVRGPRSGGDTERVLIAELAAVPGVTMLRPAALGEQACAELVRGALGRDLPAEFQRACRELTGGNPLLLGALLASLAAEGAEGAGADVAHLRRLTPAAVSRRVLLQLGRMPPGALAAARAVAVLGTAATAARAGRLAELDADGCARALAALMADGIIEGDQALRYVHPLVRSVVYQDLAPPLRQRWHARAARLLDADGAPAGEVTVHLLAAGPAGDSWVVARLRAAAADAGTRGAPDIARLCLERALAEPPPARARPEVLAELGRAEVRAAPAVAAGHLAEALRMHKPEKVTARGLARQVPVALALSEALALCGRFADGVAVLEATLADCEREAAAGRPGAPEAGQLGANVTSLEAALLHTARWDLGTRPVTAALLERLQQRYASGEPLDPRLHAAIAIELAAAGVDRDRAVAHARQAIQAMPQLMSVTSTALPETVLVLLFADLADEARAGARTWLALAQDRGWPVSAAMGASVAALVALYRGDVGEAAAYGQQAMAGAGDVWISSIAAAFLVPALAARGELAAAQAVLTGRGLAGELGPTWPFVVVRHARGALHAAAGQHPAAAADLLAAGKLAEQWGISNPAMMAWRSDAALSLSALGDARTAAALCDTEVALARRWGAGRALGIALRAAGLVAGGDRGVELLTEAVAVLRPSPAPLELARALIDLGAAHRRAGSRAVARDLLREGLDIAHGLGGAALAGRARAELVIAGGRPRRDAVRGRDALTPSELRVAQLAAAGQTNRQIAQTLFVTLRTVENHLTSSYAKLGISSRPQLAAALAAGRTSGQDQGQGQGQDQA